MDSPNSDALRRELSDAEAHEDVPKCIEICRRALADESRLDPEAELHFGLKLAGYLIAHDDHPPDTDVDEAIRVFHRLLRVITRQDKPRAWARLQLQLGGAIALRKGDPNEAIKHFENALEVLTKERDPEEWALAKKAAGEAYYRLAKDNSISELSRSLRYHREALTVFTLEKNPDEGLVEAIDMIENVIARAKELEGKPEEQR
jgi:tetratricopeptide (TPR) repeat protein